MAEQPIEDPVSESLVQLALPSGYAHERQLPGRNTVDVILIESYLTPRFYLTKSFAQILEIRGLDFVTHT